MDANKDTTPKDDALCTLPDGVTVAMLNQLLSVDRAEYTKAHQRARRLDALDRNKLWEAIQAKFPKYQLLPQTNHISYIKNNILASVYTVGKSAQLLYTSEEDKDIVENLNIALDHIWDTRDVSYYQMQAGERAALMNLGITQVGWDNSVILGQGTSFAKGQVCLKNIDPLKYYRDPFAPDLDTASHVVVWDDYHEDVIRNTKDYTTTFEKYLLLCKDGKSIGTDGVLAKTDRVSPTAANKPHYHRVYTFWIREGKHINEIHMVDGVYPLLVRKHIKPSCFPFAELFCNLPSGDLLGTSEPAKVADNSIVYNIMSSIISTSEYKNQRPPRFVNRQSGINVNAFTKHGNDADRTFVVDGDATHAVQYHTYPTPSTAAMQSMSLMQQDVQMVTGVDGRYTGRDTGSILTTGGVNSMLDQATLIDSPKVLLYEHYCKQLSKLIIFNYICNSPVPRRYLKRDMVKNDIELIEVPFPEIPEDIVLEYAINISSEMPKNKARLAATADAMIEKQMQYSGAGLDVDLITPQEWLMMQDIPNKEFFQNRMNIQRTQNWQELVAQAVTQYAALVDEGLNSADAINSTAQTMAQQQSGQGVNLEEVAQNTQMF